MKYNYPEFDCIHPIIIPFDLSPELITSNIYILGKRELTLIDSGPGIKGALDFIKERMRSKGLDIKNLKRILITHGHMDHFGLTSRILNEVDHDIDVFMHPDDMWRVTPEFFKGKQWNVELEVLGELVGIPVEKIKKIKKLLDSYYSIAEPVEKVSPMEDNDEFEGEGYSLRVIHSPGHSPGLCCFYEMNSRILFSGDHIIKHVTPNPLVTLDRDRLRNKNYQSLVAFKESLKKVSQIDASCVFPGHGDYIEDMQEVLDTYKEHQERRTQLVWEAVRRKSAPVYNLIDEVFPDKSEDSTFLALSEIIAHLELLENEGRAEIAENGPPVIYRAL